MNNQSYTILFYINKSKTNKKGVAPIYCRITFNNSRAQFSTKLYIVPEHWDKDTQSIISNHPQADYINNSLILITQKLNTIFLKLQLQGHPFDVKDLVNLYFDKGSRREVAIVSYFNTYLKRIYKLVDRDIKLATYKKFVYVLNYLKAFISVKYNKTDVLLSSLNLQFIKDFEYYLKTERALGQATINKIVQRFRRVVKEAIAEGFLDKDPFLLYKAKRVKKQVVFLSPEELAQLELKEFAQPKLQLVKDLFVFSCYTGLAYNELFRLEDKHISKGFDDFLWINMQREKTAKAFAVPLLPKAEQVINKYNTKGLIFPRLSNQKYNAYLKEVAHILAIDKRLTTHTARRTFASTVLLYNDVPMEIVSELLGHSSITITEESYGKIVQKKVSEQLKKLR